MGRVVLLGRSLPSGSAVAMKGCTVTMMDTRNVIAAGYTFQMYNHLKNKGPRYCHSCQATGAALHDAKVGSKDVIKTMHTAVEMEPRRAE